MDGTGYYPPVTAATVVPARPAAVRRRSPLGVAALVLLLGGATGVGWAATQGVASSPTLGAVLAVDAPATAAAGWGPAYVDEQGRPGRWDPCTPIAWVLQPGWIPDAGRADLAEALRRLSEASGLRFVGEGDTDELPSRDRSAYQPERYGERWAPLLIGWVPPERTDIGLGGGIQGLSAAVAVPSVGGPSLVSGQVVLDASNRLSPGFGAGTTDGEVLLHELAHAVGLNHVLDPTQVMYTTTTSSESVFGAGDRAGLAAVGAPAGCHPAPAARPLRRES